MLLVAMQSIHTNGVVQAAPRPSPGSSTPAKAFARGCTMNGREYSMDASTRPENEKARVEPVSVNQKLPSQLLGLNSSSR